MSKPQCQNCLWFEPAGAVRPFGDCRIHAPIASQDDHGSAGGWWPVVKEDHWCGEFTPTKSEGES